MSTLRWHLDTIGEHGLRLEYDPAHELWLASAEVEGDDDDEDERVAFDLTELLATVTNESPHAGWIIALVDQLEADRRLRSRRKHRWW